MTQLTQLTQLQWQLKDSKGEYHKLNDLNLNHHHFDTPLGVYVIWYLENAAAITVYAGRGTIKDLFSPHRQDKRIQQYAPKTLYGTWAAAHDYDQDGIEAYLHDQLDPLVRERTPPEVPTAVDLPFIRRNRTDAP